MKDKDIGRFSNLHWCTFKINGKQMIKITRKGEYDRIRNYERKIKSLFKIK